MPFLHAWRFPCFGLGGLNLLPLIINLICGAVGGNVAGAMFKNLSLGALWNSVAGIAGGGIGAIVLQAIGMGGGVGEGTLELSNIVGSIGSGGVGGGVLLAIVGAIKNTMAHRGQPD